MKSKAVLVVSGEAFEISRLKRTLELLLPISDRNGKKSYKTLSLPEQHPALHLAEHGENNKGCVHCMTDVKLTFKLNHFPYSILILHHKQT